ncbi:MAG TPA: hypothetical protein EYP58_05905 [bacterium (Candidatus Stahlbacteria)]|nr:hypothetical protein [Candidatus Stahlbacteria bacterium]
MDKHYWLVLLSLIVLTACPDFLGLKPKEQNILSPPDPPELIAPEDSTLFFTTSKIDFTWSSVGGAEYYELKIESKEGSLAKFQAPSTTLLDRIFAQGHYFWSVRGYAPNWEDYTDWSEERYFPVVKIVK